MIQRRRKALLVTAIRPETRILQDCLLSQINDPSTVISYKCPPLPNSEIEVSEVNPLLLDPNQLTFKLHKYHRDSQQPASLYTLDSYEKCKESWLVIHEKCKNNRFLRLQLRDLSEVQIDIYIDNLCKLQKNVNSVCKLGKAREGRH